MKNTRKRFCMAVMSLFLSVSMLVGTTFAWFTDLVTSENNIIKSGSLDVEMKWMDGTKNVAENDSSAWKDASDGEIFKSTLWEPGYTEVRHIKIANEGTVALKYQLSISATGKVSALADVINVYYIDPAMQVSNRTDLTETNKIGTLTEVLSGLSTSGTGVLVPKGEEGNGYKSVETVTIALKMQESAGNEYKDMAIGTDFSVKLFATQYTYENDSFGNDYDENAMEVASAAELQTAFNEASNGDIICLANDITLEESVIVPEGLHVTLDTNGHILQTSEDSAVAESLHVIISYGNLTVTDTAENRGAIISNNYLESGKTRYGGFAIKSVGGDLVIDGAVLDGNNWSYVVYVEGGSVTLTDATVSGRGAVYVCGGAHADIYSGTYTIDVLTTNARDNLLYLDDATANIYGGTFDGLLKEIGTNDTFNWKGSSCLMLCGKSTANVYDGYFAAREADLFVHDRYCAIYVYGGSFNTENALGNDALHEHQPGYPITNIIEVYGGLFVYNPMSHLGKGYKVENIDGYYIVSVDAANAIVK